MKQSTTQHTHTRV